MGNEKKRAVFISFIDEKNIQREGYFELLELDSSFIKFRTNNNSIITLPMIRILKIKEKEGIKNGTN